MTPNTVDAPVQHRPSHQPRISLTKRFDLFHFLFLSAGRA
jgi:hypothetical protein